MSLMKDTGEKLVLKGKEYELRFTLNALDVVQEKFGSYDKLPEVLNAETDDAWIKNLRWLLTLLINEGIEDESAALSEMQLGNMLTVAQLADSKSAIFKAFSGSSSETINDEQTGNESGNETSALE